MKKDTVSSAEATAAEKALIEDLNPWPLSNEQAWAIARKHLNEVNALEEEAHLLGIANASLEARVKRSLEILSPGYVQAGFIPQDDVLAIISILRGL